MGREGIKEMNKADIIAVINAIFNGNASQAIEHFVADGGDINAIIPEGGRPILHQCCECMDFEAIRTCARLGADLNLPDEHGHRPLHIATDIDIDSVLQANRGEVTYETVKLLISLGADPNLTDARGEKPRETVKAYGGIIFGDRNALAFDAIVASVLPNPGQSISDRSNTSES